MKVLQPVLTEQVVMFIQVALDTHLKTHGLNGIEVFNTVAQALAVPWTETDDAPAPAKPSPSAKRAAAAVLAEAAAQAAAPAPAKRTATKTKAK